MKRKLPKRDSKGRFVPKRGKLRDKRGRFVRKDDPARLDYVREIESLRREVERLKREGKAREKDIKRNYKRRGGAFDKYVEVLALGQRAKIETYLDEVYDGKISKEDFVIMAVNVGLTTREAWAVVYS